MDNIWISDLADMQLIKKYYNGIHCYYELLMFVINIHRLFQQKIKKIKQSIKHLKQL